MLVASLTIEAAGDGAGSGVGADEGAGSKLTDEVEGSRSISTSDFDPEIFNCYHTR